MRTRAEQAVRDLRREAERRLPTAPEPSPTSEDPIEFELEHTDTSEWEPELRSTWEKIRQMRVMLLPQQRECLGQLKKQASEAKHKYEQQVQRKRRCQPDEPTQRQGRDTGNSQPMET